MRRVAARSEVRGARKGMLEAGATEASMWFKDSKNHSHVDSVTSSQDAPIFRTRISRPRAW